MSFIVQDILEDWQYVLAFWFGDASEDKAVADEKSALWWGKSPDTDQLVWAKFSHRVEQASAGALTHWLAQAEGRLAAILLVDQFRRNIYRDQAEAFAEDALAQRWCRGGLERGDHETLRRIERVFFYMPLEHSEKLVDQQRSVELFEQLLAEAPAEEQALFTDYLDFAHRHHDIIARFGRFPHRNAILGRESTPEELTFLEQPGSRF